MRIEEMHITPVAVADPPLLNASGLHAPYALRTIVEMVTDSGVTGVSEIPGSAGTDRMLREAREVVVGSDPFQTTRIALELERQLGATEQRGEGSFDRRGLNHVQSAVEVACLDVVGKECGRPVADLLGGMVRREVPFAAYLFFKYRGAGGELGFEIDPDAHGWPAARQAEALTPEQIVEQARAMCREYGFRSVKLKGGACRPGTEAAAIHSLREALGEAVPLRLDPNAIWSYETALSIGSELGDVLEYFEDPVRGQKQMARLRKELGIPLATNMCTTSFSDIPGSIALGSEDIILSDHHFWGGLRPSMELSRICRTFGRGLSMHSNSHLGISLAAMVHLGAALPELSYALDTHYPWQREEVIVGGRFDFENGSIAVPTGPGLGVELDREALNRLHEQYVACGLTERNDEIEMQKVQPDWEFKPVRW